MFLLPFWTTKSLPKLNFMSRDWPMYLLIIAGLLWILKDVLVVSFTCKALRLSWFMIQCLDFMSLCCVLCLDILVLSLVFYVLILCPLVSFKCLLCSSLCLLPFLFACLSPPVCQYCSFHAFSSVPSPHYLTCPLSLSSSAPHQKAETRKQSSN